MAYVVGRPKGRFEIRESFHTPKGPRSRTLASFGVLTQATLDAAARRAQRPFDADAVMRSGERVGARVQVAGPPKGDGQRRGFVVASRRMAATLGSSPPLAARTDAGVALLELLGFADMVTAGQPPRRLEPLAFPPLGRLGGHRSEAVLAPPS